MLLVIPVPLISSFELDSPATLASMPSASDGFCKFEKGSSSVFEELERDAWSSSPKGCTPGSCDHVVPRLPSVWKLPSGAAVASDGSDGCESGSNCGCDSSTRFFFRSRRPPRLLPPSTHSRLSRLHRRHGMELSESSKHRLFLFLQFKHAICVLLIFEASSSSGLAAACAPAGCCGAFASIPHLEAVRRVGV
jgi:hypothetical protein